MFHTSLDMDDETRDASACSTVEDRAGAQEIPGARATDGDTYA